MMASTAEMAMNTAIRQRMMNTCFFSSISLIMCPLSRSRVMVELEVSTRELRVDMEADSTRITTRPISSGERFSSIAGITES